MDPDKHRSLSIAGGKAAHALGKAHEFTSAEATEAGRRGGLKTSQNRKDMSEIGKKGGNERAANEADRARS